MSEAQVYSQHDFCRPVMRLDSDGYVYDGLQMNRCARVDSGGTVYRDDYGYQVAGMVDLSNGHVYRGSFSNSSDYLGMVDSDGNVRRSTWGETWGGSDGEIYGRVEGGSYDMRMRAGAAALCLGYL